MSAPETSVVRAITVRQPWAQLIAEGVKTIEWRGPRWSSWTGTVLIHAGAARPTEDEHVGIWTVHEKADGSWAVFDEEWETFGTRERGWIDLPLGAVVAVAEITAVLPVVSYHDGGWETVESNPPTADVDFVNTNVAAIADGRVGPDASPLAIHHTRVYDNGSEHWSEPIPDQLAYAGDYAQPGNRALLLDNVRRLPQPIPAKGRLGLWRPDPALAAECLNQIGAPT